MLWHVIPVGLVAAVMVFDEVWRRRAPKVGRTNRLAGVLSVVGYVLAFILWTLDGLLLGVVAWGAVDTRLADPLTLDDDTKIIFIFFSPWPLYSLLLASLLSGLIPDGRRKLLALVFAAAMFVGLNTLAWGLGHTTPRA